MKGFPVGVLSTPTTKGHPPKKTNPFEGGLKDKGSRGFGSLKGKLEKITRFGGFRDLKANPYQQKSGVLRHLLCTCACRCKCVLARGTVLRIQVGCGDQKSPPNRLKRNYPRTDDDNPSGPRQWRLQFYCPLSTSPPTGGWGWLEVRVQSTQPRR